eukprot:scaffold5160_cov152-Cylindrotheca_fusiformis.AAC.4
MGGSGAPNALKQWKANLMIIRSKQEAASDSKMPRAVLGVVHGPASDKDAHHKVEVGFEEMDDPELFEE